MAFVCPIAFRTNITPAVGTTFATSLQRFHTMSLSKPVHASRVHTLNSYRLPDAAPSESFILYWLQSSVRSNNNPALEHAAYLSNILSIPLRTAHILDSTALDFQPLPERHALFHLQGLRDVSKGFSARSIPFTVIADSVEVVDGICKLAQNAAAVVTDASYLTRGRQIRAKAASKLKIPMYVVEGDVVVPVEVASNKAEHAARTIRPKITRLLGDYLIPHESTELLHQEKDSGWDHKHNMEVVDVTNPTKVLESMRGLDRDAPIVNDFEGGERAAERVLRDFLKIKLLGYGKGRNEPSKGLQSDLSPYLRAGNISVIDVALQAKKAAKGKSGVVKESEASFLEELIVRRELAANACWFNEGVYDVYERIVPSFAQKSLEEHKADRREKVYSYDELEAGVTADPYWNAAQLEMVVKGKMHGYMRMYWAKQILGWVEDPKVAMEYALRLNNRWELDAVDPNSYAGVIWCFGLHDQGWRERPIWGKVRYMNDAGLKRKFNMAAYLSMVDTLVAKQGLPTHIERMRKKKKAPAVQKTIEQTLKRTRSKKGSKPANKASQRPTSKAREDLLRAVKRLKS